MGITCPQSVYGHLSSTPVDCCKKIKLIDQHLLRIIYTYIEQSDKCNNH